MKSSLSNYLQPIATQEKTTKTGTARVLTSAECMEILDEKQRKKEQEAKEKEERKRERERKKIEREELAKKKNEERLEKLKKRQEEVAKKQMEVAARKAARAAKVTKGQRSTRGRDGTSTGFTALLPLLTLYRLLWHYLPCLHKLLTPLITTGPIRSS